MQRSDPATPAGAPAGVGSAVQSQDFAGGLFLIALAGVALYLAWPLATGSWTNPGPGLAPRAAAFGVGAFGVFLLVKAFVGTSDALERWPLRGPVFVLGAVVVFALTIRPLGLVVAGPLAIAISALADPQARLREIVPFAVVMTLFCIGLFSYLLNLPIPIAPWWR